MTLRDFVFSARERLGAIYPAEEAKCIVDIVCRELLGIEGFRVHVDGMMELSEDSFGKAESLEKARQAIERISQHEPWQYVLGFADFYGRRFAVNPSILIPRPETETLCRLAIEYARGLGRPVRVLDLCTGSGCIAWTMAADACAADVVGIDISAAALEVAGSQKMDVPHGMVTPEFYRADIFDDAAIDEILSRYDRFDIVLSNPPYILKKERSMMRRNVLDYEPHTALFVPDDDSMRFNKKIAEIFEKCSYMDSALFIEINENEGVDTQRVIVATGAFDVAIAKDDFGKNRVAVVTRKRR